MEIQENAAEQVGIVMQEEHGDELENLSRRFTNALQTYVLSGTVNFRTQPPDLRASSMQVDLKVADSGIETTVGRQGHGFQRALLMAAVRELSQVEESGGQGTSRRRLQSYRARARELYK
jgi:hypothetical protein